MPFMRWAKVGFPASLIAMALSVVAFFTLGLNLGIDFRGGTLIEVQSVQPVADISEIRARLGQLE
ncbi:MAG: protein translocase subunit SecF, partial [Actinobacteria bacterium]|nr:protein translocase subunit SecF [Actinomycetota bacterium]